MIAVRVVVAAVLIGGAVQARSGRGQIPAPAPVPPRVPEQFSPLGFDGLLSYMQAFPGDPNGLPVRQASSAKYWVFQGIALRAPGQGQASAWTTLGPATDLQTTEAFVGSDTASGRVTALAISPKCELTGGCRLWVGTAGGGVWRTDDAMNTTDPQWRWVGHGLGTNCIGSLTIDPTDRTGNTIIVGTGETNFSVTSGAGTGVYRSVDGGDHWVQIPTMILDPVVQPTPIDFTFTRGISTVVIDPRSAQTIYVATASAMLGMTAVRGGQTQTTGFPQPRVGLYKTTDMGTTWTIAWVPPLDPVVPPNPNIGLGVGDAMFGVRHVKLDPTDPTTVYVTAWNNGIFRSAPSLEHGDDSFKPVFAIVGLQRFQDLAMFDLTSAGFNTRMYVYNGSANASTQALYRLDRANVPAATLVTGSGANLTNTSAWVNLSSNDPSSPGYPSAQVCGTQCFYDLVVAVPDGQPNSVYVGGQFTPGLGDSTIRSTDGGATFTSFSSDAENPSKNSHVDVRAIVFHPRNPAIAFVGSDGGVVRNDGTFVDNSGQCQNVSSSLQAACGADLSSVPSQLYFMNKGLQTLQFYNVSLDPQSPLTRLIGGLQDNGTIWQDGTGDPLVWKSLFPFGDGTSASGFHPSRSGVLFASFQSANFYVNFRDGVLANWVRTGDPINASGERQSITQSTGRQFITFDTASPDTQFTGYQHVWRTQDNGGSQAFLEATCGFSNGTSLSICGDWVPLGVAFPFASGSNATSASRLPGDLTGTVYGSDRTGGLVVAAARTPADTGTLWAATNMGRVFIAKNADGPGANVTFVRLDTPSTPMRFISHIVADRRDPNVAVISYSGFNALTPQTPGHIFRLVYDPVAETATFTSLDADLGDLPINTIAYDDLRGDLYAATDFGPLILAQGSSSWQIAGVGFPEALMVDLEILPDRRLLVAATHGLGIYSLMLPPVGTAPTSTSPRRQR
jgi:hypothetical protein